MKIRVFREADRAIRFIYFLLSLENFMDDMPFAQSSANGLAMLNLRFLAVLKHAV